MNKPFQPLKRLRNTMFSWFFPSTCRLCGLAGMEHMELCEPCFQELVFNQYCCERCAIPLPVPETGRVCGQCLKHPPQFDRSISLLQYQAPGRQLIQALKFRQQMGNAGLLGRLLAERVAREGRPLPGYVIPVPLHNARLRERGYNQSVLIARVLQKQLGVEVLTGHCVRIRNTAVQSGLSLQERRYNLRDAFALRKPLPSDHVAIVDDVVTTGNTVNELARVLRRGGARVIEVWSLARA